MADTVATPSDVRIEYSTHLDDTAINDYLDRAGRENDRYNDPSSMDPDDRRDLEAALAALRIATRSDDRAEISSSSGRTSVDYEESVIERLVATIRSLDPSGELVPEETRAASFEVF